MTGAERRVRGSTFPPSAAVVLCASPRVGSTLLCDLLTGTGVLGHPKEPFFPAAEEACRAAWGVDPALGYGGYVRAAVTDGTSPNGVFATKVMWRDLRRLTHRLDEPSARPVVAEVRHTLRRTVAVHLRRRDLLAAAVSQLRAEATGQWSSARRGDAPEGPVDWPRLHGLHRAQHRADRGWSALLPRLDVASLTFVYEDWTDRPLATVGSIGAAVDVEVAEVAASPLRVQRDSWNQSVRAGYVERYGSCARCG